MSYIHGGIREHGAARAWAHSGAHREARAQAQRIRDDKGDRGRAKLEVLGHLARARWCTGPNATRAQVGPEPS